MLQITFLIVMDQHQDQRLLETENNFSMLDDVDITLTDFCSDLALEFEDISDIEDPTYTPESSTSLQRKVIPNLFHIRSTNKKDVIGESSKEHRIEVFSPSSASDSSNTHLSTDSDSTQTSISADWLDKVSAYSYLDGNFFKPVKLLEENKKVHGQCQLCLPKVTIIKAQLGVSTNFLMHLRRNHGRAIEDYNTHKASKLRKNLSKSNRECTNGDLGEDSGPPLKRQKKLPIH